MNDRDSAQKLERYLPTCEGFAPRDLFGEESDWIGSLVEDREQLGD